LNLSRTDISILKSDEGEKIENGNDLKQLILVVCGLVGIKEMPDGITIKNCWDALDHFKSFTKDNFLEAFKFNEAGVYETRAQHYNSFLPAYMSEVLNNYRSMRNKAQSDYKKQLKALEPEPESMTPEESYNGLIKYFEENKTPPRFWDWNKVFVFMEEASIIQMTIAEKNLLFAKVKNDVELLKSTATDSDQLKEINKQLLANNLVTECRRIAVINTLK